MSDRFVAAYQAYFDEVIGRPVPFPTDPDADAWAESQRLRKSAEGDRWLRRFEAGAPPDTQWRFVAPLYSAFRWNELNVPMMRLIGPDNRLLNDVLPYALREGAWPFALDLGDGGYYAVDVASGGNGDVWWCPNETWDRRARRGPIATSMGHLLDVVALLLTGSPRGPLTDEEIRREVRAIDPLVAAAPWDDWWARQLA